MTGFSRVPRYFQAREIFTFKGEDSAAMGKKGLPGHVIVEAFPAGRWLGFRFIQNMAL
jgi:hypothetical protein